MLRWTFGFLFPIIFLFFYPSNEVFASTQEWIFYFDSEEAAETFQIQHPNIKTERHKHMLKVWANDQDIEAWHHLHPNIVQIEPNFIKSIVSSIPNDPLNNQQWALVAIQSHAVFKQYPQQENKLWEQTITYDETSFSYTGQSFFANEFEIDIPNEQLSRLSVTLSRVEHNWELSVYDENGQLLAQNEGGLPTLDVLLPKKRYSKLTVTITLKDHWKTHPVIERLIGVDHVTVAVVDTGANEHVDFCDNILFSLGKDFREGMTYPYDTNGHGTHVTGILGACSNNGIGMTSVVGQAPIDIIPLKALDKNGLGGDFEISQAVEDALSLNVDVINLSLAGKGKTVMLEQSIAKAFQQNVMVVAAAGNLGKSTELFYPASYPYVITVAGVDTTLKRASFSNFGWEVDISAPATDILSTYGENEYRRLNGTSMATPMVSGLAALIKYEYPDEDIVRWRSRLFLGSLDIGNRGFDKETGHGFIQMTTPFESITPNKLEWLTLYNQQMGQKGNYLLTVSPSLMGESLHIALNGEPYIDFKIDNTMLSIPISFEGTNPIFRVLSVVVEDQTLIHTNQTFVQNLSPSTETFSDVPSSFWAYQEIKGAYTHGFINGYNDGTFRPNASIKRRHAAMMMSRLLQWDGTVPYESPFVDLSVALDEATLSILHASQRNVLKGYSNGYFHPDRSLLRSQMALILARALNLADTLIDVNQPYPFQDIKESDEFYIAVQNLAARGIITKQDYFRPYEPMTRAQFAAMVERTYQYLNKK
ncbi:MAG: S8 family serine peptidase [Bacillus sp. (in: Bacteria)]|nr:S8 family serine peptidase [Bacillus sp. (in: firmicutes)]